MAYRESETPTIDSLKASLDRIENHCERQRKEILRLRENTRGKVLKGLYVFVLAFSILGVIYRWTIIKEAEKELEKHYTEYHEKIVSNHKDSAVKKERAKFLKQRDAIFTAGSSWIERYTDGSGDPWCSIPDQNEFRNDQTYPCTVRFENHEPVNLDCSTERCYRKFE